MRSFNPPAAAVLTALALLAPYSAFATNHGVIGPVHPIAEPDMLEWMENKVAAKVASGEALRYQQQQAEKMKDKLKNPVALTTVSKASRNRTFFYDPTFIVDENVTDDKGRILVPAGTTINPLDRIGLSRPLIFFDARDKAQVAFAKKFIDGRDGMAKPILVGGRYFDLMKLWKTPVFFDQQSALIRKFGIQHVPAIVVQDGRKLRIDEIAF